MIVAIEAEQRPLEIRSDSTYVFYGCQSIAGGTRSKHLSGDNADLWSVLSCLVASRDREAVIMIKVKGHAKDRHVASGEVLAIDKWGNDKADTLAVEGGLVHSAPAHLVAAYNRRREMSKAIHKLMLSILEARRKAECVLGFGSPDNEEEESEDPWSLDLNMSVPHPRSGEG